MIESQKCPRCHRRMPSAGRFDDEYYGTEYYNTYFYCRRCRQWFEEEFVDYFSGPTVERLEPISPKEMLKRLAAKTPSPGLADELKLGDIPDPDADWDTISDFALTFDGYVVWGSSDMCAEVANARCDDSLIDLRTCLFFEQRRWHHLGEEPDDDARRYIREIVDNIRGRVAAGESA